MTSYVMYIIYKTLHDYGMYVMLCDALFYDNITRTCHLISSCLLFLENMIQQTLCVVFFDEIKHTTLHVMICSNFTFPVQHTHVFFYSLVSVT